MCESCKKGYDGRNGNGYQPCGGKHTCVSEFINLESRYTDDNCMSIAIVANGLLIIGLLLSFFFIR